MAEFLIRISPHWMDNFTQKQINDLSEKELVDYNARTRPGDIVAVAVDGFVWGREERPPTFAILKIPDMLFSEAKNISGPLYSEDINNPVLLKRNKFNIGSEYASLIKIAPLGAITVSKNNFISKLITKTN